MVDVTRIRMSGPVQPVASGFSQELSRLGYTYFSARQQLELAAHLSRWMVERSVGLDTLTKDTVREFIAARGEAGFTAFRSPKALDPLMTYLRRIGATPVLAAVAPMSSADPVEALLARYREYLRSERGVTAKTARDYADAVRPFLKSRVSSGGLELESATAADVTAFILGECQRRRVRAAQMMVTATRSLLRFLQVQGLVDGSLGLAVPRVPDRREALARSLTLEQVQALLQSCDQGAFGRRDFAIMMMLARLGLRAGEVAQLRLEDVDWRRGEILIRGKPNRHDRLPLPVDVGEALVPYLHAVRPADALDRCVFCQRSRI